VVDAEDDPSEGAPAPVDTAGTVGDGATLSDLGANTTSVAPGSMSGGTVAAVLDAAPESVTVALSPPLPSAPPVSGPPPVSRTVPVTLSPPLSRPLEDPVVSTAPVAAAEPRRRRWPWAVGAVLVVGLAAVGVQLARPFPAVALQRAVPGSTPVAGAVPALPWPTVGEAAVAVPQLGITVDSGPEAAVPIASLTKIMTAYLTLRDHPLSPQAQGPTLTMTAADQADASVEELEGATNVPVQPGETLTERQLLNGLLVHSANNLADVLAQWDAGSIPAFVAKMNAAAASLGMTHTHYADASGLDPGTRGTAGDELLVTQAAMAIPTFAAVVAQPSVTLPIIGQLTNYVSSVGTDDGAIRVVGVKSGFTQAAMGCLVLAGEGTVAGHQVLVLAAVTGQPGDDPLSVANQVDERLLDATAAGLREVPVTPSGVRVGTVTLPWSHARVPLVAAAPITVLAWPGQEPRLAVSTRALRTGMPAGERVGTLSASIGHEHVAVPVQVVATLRGPSMRWRLKRS
jgi:D-alanyl-D-alanine carboxypeptidase (penicillin-binding protein 5/6)